MNNKSPQENGYPTAIPDKSTRYPTLEQFRSMLFSDSGEMNYGYTCELPPEQSFYYDSIFPKAPEMISDAHGSIKKILMTYPYLGNDDFGYPKLFASFLKSLPKSIHVYLLANVNPNDHFTDEDARWRKALKELKRILQKIDFQKDRYTIIKPNGIENYSIWAQDPFIPVIDQEGDRDTIFLVEPIKFKEIQKQNGESIINGDSEIADCLARDNCIDGVLTNQSRVCLFFQGGNVLAGDDFILIGQDDINKTKALFRSCFAEPGLKLPHHEHLIKAKKSGVQVAFQQILGSNKLVIPIGNKKRLNHFKKNASNTFFGLGEFQPFFHIDLFITLAGYLFDEPYYTLVLAEPFNASPEPNVEIDRQIIRPLQRSLWKLKMNLEKITINGRRKFIVRRMPMPIVPVKKGNTLSWKPMTYNNCLVEIHGNNKKIWVPQYGDHPKVNYLEVYDELAIKIWNSLEFTTEPVDHCFPFINRGGAIRCITKCLQRG